MDTSHIDIWSLDAFCDAQLLQPDLIKIDVEGYQAKIIPGAANLIANLRPIVLLEFDGPDSDNSFGVSNKEVIASMMQNGYQLIWGRHRSQKDRFQVLKWEELSDQHEVNALGILVP